MATTPVPENAGQANGHYDAIIIGSGQAGTPLASALATSGRRTALIESKHVGGTCVNEGCTPTKTMVASARVAYLARRAADYGIHFGDGQDGEVRTDMVRVRERKRKVVASFNSGSEKKLRSTEGVELIFGTAAFSGPKTVQVATNDGRALTLTAGTIFINTGLRASIPHVDGLATVPYLDNVSIMELDHVPEHLIVLGGGDIGLEFAQMFRRFGSRVTIVQSGPQLLVKEDEDVAEELRKIFVEDGIDVLLKAKATAVRKTDTGVELDLEQNGASHTLSGSHLLVATGRIPNTESLGLATAGIAVDDRGFIQVDEVLETSVQGVFALGDVKGGPAFTHISYDDFRIIRANLIEGKHATTAGRLVPYTVFIDPQLGRIGLTEAEARKQGKNIKVAKMPMSSVARAIEVDETRGLMKAVIDMDTELILGAAVLGIEGGETASLIQVAMMGKLPYTALRDGIFSHPTLSEALNNLLQKLT